MTKLTESQTRLLTAAASADAGIIVADDHHKTIAALVSRGLFTALEGDGPPRLQITDLGREAISGGGDEGRSAPPADGDAINPPPPPRHQIGTLVALDLGSQPSVPISKPKGPAADTAPAPKVKAQPKGKTAALIAMLRRPEGGTIETMVQATGWQAHSVRGCLSGAIKKGLGLEIASDKTEGGRVYRIVEPAA